MVNQWSKEKIDTFRSYVSMVERTRIQKGRWYGLPVEDKWLESFECFVEDVGLRPKKNHTLGRIDNNSGYVVGNVRWATPKTQARNRSNTLKVIYKGKERVLVELCEELGVDYELVRGRLKVGMDLEKALTTHKRHNWTKIKVDGKTVRLREYCEMRGASYQLVRDRLRWGWCLDRAITTPKKSV